MGVLTQTTAELQQILDDVQGKAGASAYLSAPSSVETTVAGSWYPIAGTFTNAFEDFEFDTDHIKYIGDEDYVFEIDWHASLTTDTSTTTFHIAIKHNTTVLDAQQMGAMLKNTNQYVPCSGTSVIELTKNDEIQLVCSSDKTEANLSFEHFNATINKFYQSRV